MIKYGGHAQAGGFSLKQEKTCRAFMERYNEFLYALSTFYLGSNGGLRCMLTPGGCNGASGKSFSAMAPFGMGNPTPTALFENVR